MTFAAVCSRKMLYSTCLFLVDAYYWFSHMSTKVVFLYSDRTLACFSLGRERINTKLDIGHRE